MHDAKAGFIAHDYKHKHNPLATGGVRMTSVTLISRKILTWQVLPKRTSIYNLHTLRQQDKIKYNSQVRLSRCGIYPSANNNVYYYYKLMLNRQRAL